MSTELENRATQVAGECNALEKQIERIADAQHLVIMRGGNSLNSIEYRQYELQLKQLRDELDRKKSLYTSLYIECGYTLS